MARPRSSVVDDPLLLVLHDGARRMLQQEIEADVETFLAAHAEHDDGQGRRRVVRNGHASERAERDRLDLRVQAEAPLPRRWR